MTQLGPSGADADGVGDAQAGLPALEGRDRGMRRRKLAGYIKAANELRQTYQQSYANRSQRNSADDGDDHGIPGAFPDVAVVRNGDEEMVLFPSYARRHIKQRRPRETVNDRPQADDTTAGRHNSTAEDADFWREEWKRHEDDNAIVDVDIRGWIYSPHRGPMSRKNRLLIGLARQLSGIPVPSSNNQGAGDSKSASKSSTHEQRVKARAEKQEEQLVAKEAESILQKGQGEADIAERGGYSEDPSHDSDRGSTYSKDSRASTPDIARPSDSRHSQAPHPLTNSLNASDESLGTEVGALAKRQSWNQPADMSPAELSVANAHLMARLKPFLTDPVASTPVTVFFYNEDTSQSRTIMTNDAGHFSLRAALDFVPTDVRVLASENLSATEKVRITEPTGVSVISDIDDTIKHSAVGSGAKEIFRNTFIRDLGDLTIEGVQQWYKRLENMGVNFHYVSNSPWQLYPVLVSYFSMAGLPPGSFHLKQYSGMLQGIFEPVAERKKSTLSRIMQDFPDRKFILVGDSGEADLEVYTDVVVGNPARIIGVYIRDITTPLKQGFFDSAMGPLNGDRNTTPRNGNSISAASTGNGNGTGSIERKPVLPPRRPSANSIGQQKTGPIMGTLIDLDDEPATSRPDLPPRPSVAPHSMTDCSMATERELHANKSIPTIRSPVPEPPNKPPRLRSRPSSESPTQERSNDSPNRTPSKRDPPPLPTKPRRYSNNKIKPDAQRNTSPKTGDQPDTTARQSYVPASVRQKVSSAYNKLPSAAAVAQGISRIERPPLPPPSVPHRTRPSAVPDMRRQSSPYTPSIPQSASAPPPRRGLTSYPAAAAQYATTRLGNAWNGTVLEGGGGGGTGGDGANEPMGTKKEELWRRRWARAADILAGKGVQLRSWRVGEDVMDDAVKLVEQALREGGDNKVDRRR